MCLTQSSTQVPKLFHRESSSPAVLGIKIKTLDRAEWAKDGSFLAFRYLFQQVPEFNNFLKKNPIAKDGNGKALTANQGSELL